MLDPLKIPEENGRRITCLEIPFGIFKLRSNGPNHGTVRFTNLERMGIRNYLQILRNAQGVAMATIPTGAVRYRRFQMKAKPQHLAGSVKSQLLNYVNRNSSWVEVRNRDRRGNNMHPQYEYVDYYTHVKIRDDNDNIENHYLAKIYIHPVEALDILPEGDIERYMLIRLVDRTRAERRRRRQQAGPRWVWNSVADITRVMGTMKVAGGTYIIMTPSSNQDVMNPTLAFANEDGNAGA